MELPTLDFDLGENVELLRKTVRDFSEKQIAPLAESVDRDNQFPNELWPQLGDPGRFGSHCGRAVRRPRPWLPRPRRRDGRDFPVLRLQSGYPTGRIQIYA